MISFYDVNIQYNLEELKEFFESIEDLKSFIDKEEIPTTQNLESQYYVKERKVHCLMLILELPICNFI
jgi:hypothetical protein